MLGRHSLSQQQYVELKRSPEAIYMTSPVGSMTYSQLNAGPLHFFLNSSHPEKLHRAQMPHTRWRSWELRKKSMNSKCNNYKQLWQLAVNQIFFSVLYSWILWREKNTHSYLAIKMRGEIEKKQDYFFHCFFYVTYSTFVLYFRNHKYVILIAFKLTLHFSLSYLKTNFLLWELRSWGTKTL